MAYLLAVLQPEGPRTRERGLIENKWFNSSPQPVLSDHLGLAQQFDKFHGVLKWLRVNCPSEVVGCGLGEAGCISHRRVLRNN